MNLWAKTDFLQHKPHPLAASWSTQGIVGPGRICKESSLSSKDLFATGIPSLELMNTFAIHHFESLFHGVAVK